MSRRPAQGGTESNGARWRRAAKRALWSGSLASVVSTITLAVCGKREEDSAAGPINGPSQWLWGEREAHTTRLTVRHTVTGYVIHHAMSIGWAVLYERLFAARGRIGSNSYGIASAAVTAALAHAVDYHMAPKRLRPGFRKHLGPTSIFAVYVAFAVGLAASRVMESSRKRPNRTDGYP